MIFMGIVVTNGGLLTSRWLQSVVLFFFFPSTLILLHCVWKHSVYMLKTQCLLFTGDRVLWYVKW